MVEQYPEKQYRTETTELPTHPPSDLRMELTQKQYEVLYLLSTQLNLEQIRRKLNLASKSSVSDRIQGLVKKGYVKNDDLGIYELTSKGKKAVEGCTVGGTVRTYVSTGKNLHAINYTVEIQKFPSTWTNQNLFIQNLKPNKYFYNERSKTWNVYFSDCNFVISSQKVNFFPEKIEGIDFDDMQSQAFDTFIKYHSLLIGNGFALSNKISSRTPHFADKNGFYARLATSADHSGFKIQTDKGDFWIDYSTGEAEEETDSEEVKKRIEDLAKSDLNSDSTLIDVDKLKIIVRDLVKLESMRYLNDAKN